MAESLGRSAHGRTAHNPRSRITTVYAWRSERPHTVSILEHADALRCASLLPDMAPDLAGLRCTSPACCDARCRAMYIKVAAYAEHVRRWKSMVSTKETIATGVSKTGSDFEARVLWNVQTVVSSASLLWQTMCAEDRFARPQIRELAPLDGGPPRPVADVLTALGPDVLAIVLSYVLRKKMEAGEPVGNICALRMACTSFATHPIFEPFKPRLIRSTSTCVPDRAFFPHRPRGSGPAAVYAHRVLLLAIRLSLPGDPTSKRLLALDDGPLRKDVPLRLSLMVTHPDDSVHDVTARFVQKRTLTRRALAKEFRF